MQIEQALTHFDPVMGLEVHVELNTHTKMFCGCPTTFGAEPNSQVCPVCLGLPGSLPVVNGTAVESAIRIGLALNCQIADWCRFARKNYFYPDMPKDYQISQYDEPIAFDGFVELDVEGERFRIEIERAHMEEDTGKSLHVGGSGRIQGAEYSLLDYNRCGVPLIEIVTKPIVGAGLKAPAVARAYVAHLRDLLKALAVSDVRMEQGSLRCDANLSLMAKDATEFGTRTETKNVNSLRSVEGAVRYEIERQADLLLAGTQIVQETRHWNEQTQQTSSGRSKETAEDYRYFPEPDLVPVAVSAQWIDHLRATLHEPPAERLKRLREQWQLSDTELATITNAGALDLIDQTVAAGASVQAARKWWTGELLRRANESGIELSELAISPEQVVQVQQLIDEGTINDQLARQVFEGVLAGEGQPSEVIAARGLAVVSDEGALAAAVDEAIAAHPEVAAKIRDGKVAAAGALIGAVMKAMQGQADASRVRELVLAKLS